MRSGESISALLRRFFVENTDLQNEEEAHGNVFATEDLHEAKEHVLLEGSGKGVQVLRMVEIRNASNVSSVWRRTGKLFLTRWGAQS